MAQEEIAEGAPPAPKEKKGRKSNPKTRTGCVTCKTRRVKCDEGKPHCKRCISTGRTCDGYRSPSSRPLKVSGRSTPVRLAPAPTHAAPKDINPHIKSTRQSPSNSIPLSLSTHPKIPPSDLRALQHFHSRTSSVLGGWLLAPFWTYQLPQQAHTQPSTRHAIIAISSIHENIERLRSTPPHDPRLEHEHAHSASSPLMLFAERHYQAAVSALARSLAAGTANEEVALTSCAMFVVFNFLSGGNFSRAVWHMQYGIEILSRWKWGRGTIGVKDEGSLEANLVELMRRISLDGEAMEETVSIRERDDVGLDAFENLDAAGRAVQELSKEGLRLIRLNVLVEKGDAGTARRQSLRTDVAAHVENLKLWQASLEVLIADPHFILTTEDKDLITQFRILHLSARIWIHAGFPPTYEPQSTKLFARFIGLVDQQYERWRSRGLEQYARRFLFDKGLLPTINYILSSSDGELRTRAVDIWIKLSPRCAIDVIT